MGGIRILGPLGDGWEYSLDGVTWQTEPLFTAQLNGEPFVPGQEYLIEIRNVGEAKRGRRFVTMPRAGDTLDEVASRDGYTDADIELAGSVVFSGLEPASAPELRLVVFNPQTKTLEVLGAAGFNGLLGQLIAAADAATIQALCAKLTAQGCGSGTDPDPDPVSVLVFGNHYVDIDQALAGDGGTTTPVPVLVFGTHFVDAFVYVDLPTDPDPDPDPDPIGPPLLAGGYRGSHETNTCYLVTGWLSRDSDRNAAQSVDIYLGDTKQATVSTTKPRPDVATALGQTGSFNQYGFEWTIPAEFRTGVALTITVRVAGTATALTYSPKTTDACPTEQPGGAPPILHNPIADILISDNDAHEYTLPVDYFLHATSMNVYRIIDQNTNAVLPNGLSYDPATRKLTVASTFVDTIAIRVVGSNAYGSTPDDVLITLNRPGADTRKRVLVVGSSSAVGNSAPGNNGAMQQLATALSATHSFVNRAVGGSYSSQWINRIDQDLQEVNPHYVIVWLTLGNEWSNALQGDVVGYDTFTVNYGQLVNKIRAVGAIPIMIDSLTRPGLSPAQYSLVKQEWAQINTLPAYVLGVGALGDDGTGGYLPAINADNIHWNDLGHQQAVKTMPREYLQVSAMMPALNRSTEAGRMVTVSEGIPFKLTRPMASFTTAFELRFDSEQATLFRSLFSQHSIDNDQPGVRLRIAQADRRLELIYATGTLLASTQTPLSIGTWHRIVVRYNAISGVASLFVNEVAIGSGTLTAGIEVPFLSWGGRTNGTPSTAQGYAFRNIQVWQTTLSDGQISNLPNAMPRQALIVYSPIDDNLGTGGGFLTNQTALPGIQLEAAPNLSERYVPAATPPGITSVAIWRTPDDTPMFLVRSASTSGNLGMEGWWSSLGLWLPVGYSGESNIIDERPDGFENFQYQYEYGASAGDYLTALNGTTTFRLRKADTTTNLLEFQFTAPNLAIGEVRVIYTAP
ncbi:hypothetical protein [Spirosoma sp. 209]|uniref:hypothetical protein n=1 Tax=Spirosoma sp. 209 TaxID=1955701 RepID=UPI00098D0FDD|nr:hypothetical protein [Spirosoma sp. 209]